MTWWVVGEDKERKRQFVLGFYREIFVVLSKFRTAERRREQNNGRVLFLYLFILRKKNKNKSASLPTNKDNKRKTKTQASTTFHFRRCSHFSMAVAFYCPTQCFIFPVYFTELFTYQFFAKMTLTCLQALDFYYPRQARN